jgi:hypothetical protein
VPCTYCYRITRSSKQKLSPYWNGVHVILLPDLRFVYWEAFNKDGLEAYHRHDYYSGLYPSCHLRFWGSWLRSQYAPLKRRFTPRLHGVISQKALTFIIHRFSIFQTFRKMYISILTCRNGGIWKVNSAPFNEFNHWKNNS